MISKILIICIILFVCWLLSKIVYFLNSPLKRPDDEEPIVPPQEKDSVKIYFWKPRDCDLTAAEVVDVLKNRLTVDTNKI